MTRMADGSVVSNEDRVAGGGLLHRRLLFGAGSMLAGAALVAPRGALGAANPHDDLPPSMLKPGATMRGYGQPSPYEASVQRGIGRPLPEIAPGTGVSNTPLQYMDGFITPNGLHFERHHNGVPDIDPKTHKVLIHGLVQRPLTFTVEDLLRYPMVSRLVFIECGGNSGRNTAKEPLQLPFHMVNGLLSCAEWTGVPLGLLLEEAGVDPRGKWILAESADAAGMSRSIPLEKAMGDTIVALYQNGERVRPENGYPARLVVPGWIGNINVKWLRRIKVVDRPYLRRMDGVGQPNLMPDGKARQLSFVLEAKSVITFPSGGQQLPGLGLYEIRGLAWSGRGLIRRVEVSTDSGKTWRDAHLQEPVLPLAHTRFRLDWRWDGREAVLQSRGTDETGYVQPTLAELVKVRGLNSIYFNNAIQSWKVAADGSVHNVHV
ncbi:MAG TPA: sulfite dehydrogenase [Acetobacteraceae bacterium]|nr:sulfite dehydrogenase [Acetobacteraceae bacterium]